MAQVRTRKRGKTWSFIFEAGQVNGKRKVVEKGGFPTKDAAYKAGVEKYTDFLHGNIGITSEAITLKDFMTQWLNEVVALNVKPTTMQTYRPNIENHIFPKLGEVKVQDLTPAMLDKWIRELQHEGLSFRFIGGLHALIKQALDYAVHPAQLINSNPASYIKVPKNAPRNIVKRYVITDEQFHALIEKYPFGTPFHIPFLLLYHTGMRLGEVLGLSWNDIDFIAKKINLSRQLVYLHKRGYFLTTLKTESSKRYILIDDYLLEELRHWKIQQAEDEQDIGGRYIYTYLEDGGRILRRSKGLPCDKERAQLVCIKPNGGLVLRSTIISKLQAEGLNAHSFRHTHATQLIESGAKPKGVAARLGHTNALITQNLYTHNTRKLQEETLEIFNKRLQTNEPCRQVADDIANKPINNNA